jgi:WXG100 family type VII secretion target
LDAVGFLKVDEAAVNQIASLLKANAAARKSDLARLGARVSPNVVWEGATPNTYEKKYQAWRAAEINLIQALDELGQVVQEIIQNFQTVDQQGASALR